MSLQDDLYDVAAEVKGTDAEESFERFAKWACQMETDLENLLDNYNVLISAFKLIKDKDEVNKAFAALDAANPNRG